MATLNMSNAQAVEVSAQLMAAGISFFYRCTGEMASAIGHQITVDDSREFLLAHCLEIAKERLARGRN